MRKLYYTILPVIIFLFALPTKAQKQVAIPSDLPPALADQLDKKLTDWQTKHLLKPDKNCKSNEINPTYSDSVYIDRLSRIPTTIEMPFNKIVRRYIDVYAGKNRTKVAYMLGAANFYMPIFEEALDAYQMPLELKYLPIIESALNPTAKSRVGASGLWQFMYSTGRIYGLTSNTYIDERRDPIKSTWAAAKYLKDLYGIYHDWILVIAAYNCGPGNVNKAIRRNNGNRDFWKIYESLPRETRGYVPAFIAANYIMTYYCKHNICAMESEYPIDTDTLHINKNLHLKQVADLCDISLEQLQSLNPQYKKDVLPGRTKTCILRLPRKIMGQFIDYGKKIYEHHKEKFFTNRTVVQLKSASKSSKSYGSGRVTYHKIRRGESLSTIAHKYRTSVSKIKEWNKLRNSSIRAGKKLKIYK